MCMLKINVSCVLWYFLKFTSATALTPILIIPGYYCSVLNATVTQPQPICPNVTQQLLWPSNDYASAAKAECWSNNMKLSFSQNKSRTTAIPGVNVSVTNFTNYLDSIVAAVRTWGYVEGQSFIKAPFDWRKAPNDDPEYDNQLKTSCERLFATNSKPVTLIAHSYGNLKALHFLQQQSADWKKKYVKAYIALGGPFTGSAGNAEALISGGISGTTAGYFRAAQRTFSSLFSILPNRFGWPNKTIIQTAAKHYTASDADYRQVFEDISFQQGKAMLSAFSAKVNITQAPGVPVFCMYGTQTATKAILNWTADTFPDKMATYGNEDGDGVVPTKSSQFCQNWISRQSEPVVVREMHGTIHSDLVQSETSLNQIQDYLLQE